jgi:hypothetical protein
MRQHDACSETAICCIGRLREPKLVRGCVGVFHLRFAQLLQVEDFDGQRFNAAWQNFSVVYSAIFET